jgi:hypothetical protein
MTDRTPTQNRDRAPVEDNPPTVIRCLGGAALSSGMATGLYFLTASIAQTFAEKPLQSDSATVQNIGAAVRTLVVGLSALGTFVFALSAFGLLALAIQIGMQRMQQE